LVTELPKTDTLIHHRVTLDLKRGYEAPVLVRPDRLPLGKD